MQQQTPLALQIEHCTIAVTGKDKLYLDIPGFAHVLLKMVCRSCFACLQSKDINASCADLNEARVEAVNAIHSDAMHTVDAVRVCTRLCMCV